MAVTQELLDDFHRFASAKLRNGGAESLLEIVRAWLQVRQRMETVADIEQGLNDFAADRGTLESATESIRRGIDDADAGRLQSVDDVDEELRRKHDIPVNS